MWRKSQLFFFLGLFYLAFLACQQIQTLLKINCTKFYFIAFTKYLYAFEELLDLVPLIVMQFLKKQKLGLIILNVIVNYVYHIGIKASHDSLIFWPKLVLPLLLSFIQLHIQTRDNRHFLSTFFFCVVSLDGREEKIPSLSLLHFI